MVSAGGFAAHRGGSYIWQAFFATTRSYRRNLAASIGRPCLPKYKDKLTGLNLLTDISQALSRPTLRQGRSQPSGLPITIQTRQAHVQPVRIVPHKAHDTVKSVYEKQVEVAPHLNPAWRAGIDLEPGHLAAIREASKKPSFTPLLVNGRPLKAINQFYNKRRAELQASLSVGRWSRHLDRLTDRRHRRLQYELHLASRRMIDHGGRKQGSARCRSEPRSEAGHPAGPAHASELRRHPARAVCGDTGLHSQTRRVPGGGA